MAKSQYGRYIEEREGCDILETAKGFISWKEDGEYMFICDLFVEKDYRNKGVARSFVDHVMHKAKMANKLGVAATCDEAARNYKEAYEATLRTGFEDVGKEDSVHYMVKRA